MDTRWIKLICALFLMNPSYVWGRALFLNDEAPFINCPMECQCDETSVYCSGAGITSIPNDLSVATLRLELSKNSISSIDGDAIARYRKLQILNLYGNEVNYIRRDAFQNTPNVTTLDLGYNKLRSVSYDMFSGLDQLRNLNLQGNQLDSVPSFLSQFPNLLSINLGANNIREIRFDAFRNNPKLRFVNISANELISIDPNTFSYLPYLRYLILHDNPALGKQVSDLKIQNNSQLYYVDVSNCGLSSMLRNLPKTIHDFRIAKNNLDWINADDFRNATNLDLLVLNNNNIGNIERGALGYMKNLRELWLNGNNLELLPKLPANLKALYADRNKLREIRRDSFTRMPLEIISLQSNKIRTIESNTFSDIPLRQIDISANQIENIQPRVFNNLGMLETMDLSANPIQEIARDALMNLPRLRRLQISRVLVYTSVRDPTIFGRLPSLKYFDISENPGLARSIIDSRVDLSQVEDYNLMYNNLQSLPTDFAMHIPKIRIIKLSGNRWHCNNSLAWFNLWMTRNPRLFWAAGHVMCTTPMKYRYQPIQHMTLAEFESVRGPPDEDRVDNIPPCCWDQPGVGVKPQPKDDRPYRGTTGNEEIPWRPDNREEAPRLPSTRKPFRPWEFSPTPSPTPRFVIDTNIKWPDKPEVVSHTKENKTDTKPVFKPITQKPVGKPEPEMKPVTSKPDEPEIILTTPKPNPVTTSKPETMPVRTSKPEMMPVTTSKPETMPVTTLKPETMPVTTSKPETMPITHKPEMKQMTSEPEVQPDMMEITTKPVAEEIREEITTTEMPEEKQHEITTQPGAEIERITTTEMQEEKQPEVTTNMKETEGKEQEVAGKIDESQKTTTEYSKFQEGGEAATSIPGKVNEGGSLVKDKENGETGDIPGKIQEVDKDKFPEKILEVPTTPPQGKFIEGFTTPSAGKIIEDITHIIPKEIEDNDEFPWDKIYEGTTEKTFKLEELGTPTPSLKEIEGHTKDPIKKIEEDLWTTLRPGKQEESLVTKPTKQTETLLQTTPYWDPWKEEDKGPGDDEDYNAQSGSGSGSGDKSTNADQEEPKADMNTEFDLPSRRRSYGQQYGFVDQNRRRSRYESHHRPIQHAPDGNPIRHQKPQNKHDQPTTLTNLEVDTPTVVAPNAHPRQRASPDEGLTGAVLQEAMTPTDEPEQATETEKPWWNIFAGDAPAKADNSDDQFQSDQHIWDMMYKEIGIRRR